MSFDADPVTEITVVVADDHAVVRAGARQLLERAADVRVVGEAGTLEEAERLLARRAPDVLLLDLRMPGGGLDAVGPLHVAWPAVALVVFTMRDDLATARTALEAGAAGFAVKDAPQAELLTAVRVVASGGRYLDPRVGARLLDDSATSPDGLTERERAVLRLLALGFTNAEAASRLYLSVRTVEAYRAQVQAKLGVATRHELVAHALRRGLLAPPD